MALVNSSKSVVSVRKSDHLAEIRSTELVNVRALVSEKKDPFQYKDLNKVREDPEEHLGDLQVDPDNILTEEQRQIFHKLHKRYAKLFTPRPGKYNGY